MNEFVYSYKREEHPKLLASKCLVIAPDYEYGKEIHPKKDEFLMTAVWDTGATCSAISKGLVDFLGLKPTGRLERLSGANGIYESDTYRVDFYLSEDVVFRDILVSDMPHDDRILILVGLDIILQTDFSLQTGENSVELKIRIK